MRQSVSPTEGLETLQLSYGVGGVRHYLADEYILIRIEPLFDYRKYMLCFDGYAACFLFFCFFRHKNIPF